MGTMPEVTQGSGFFNKKNVLAGIDWFWSTKVEMYFVSFLACDGVRQHEWRWILCPLWNERGLLNNDKMHYCPRWH
jgi:hypothetical protein